MALHAGCTSILGLNHFPDELEAIEMIHYFRKPSIYRYSLLFKIIPVVVKEVEKCSVAMRAAWHHAEYEEQVRLREVAVAFQHRNFQ